MFAPAPTGESQNTTSSQMITRSRRRQRPSSSDHSLPLPKSKRLRSDRSQAASQPNADTATVPETYEVKSTLPSATEVKQDGMGVPVAVPRQELTVRSKKTRTGDRLHKGDGTTLLSTNVAFEVRKLPALPERMTLDATSRQHGFIDSSTGSALSLSHTHAIVWPYTTASLSPESFAFILPYPSKHSTDPLPLGSLVSPSASSTEPGLVVVMPMSGRVTYWESISSATALDFMRQQRTSAEDSITGMFSSERVIELVNVESAAGFILAFSSGRVAYLSVRDAQGRPKVSVQFLRTSLGPSRSGFFGSIRNALSQSIIQADIAAVRADRSSKQGECTVVAATSRGRVNSWRIHRGGHHDLLADLDVKDAVIEAIQRVDPMSSAPTADAFKIVDFCFVPKGMSSKYTDMSKLRQIPASESQQHLLFLTAFDGKDKTQYYLVELVIYNGEAPETAVDVGMVRPISSFSVPPDPHALAKPRLYLPKPGIIAFLVFDHATVVASIALPPVSPDSQIMRDNHTLPTPFEDVVDLRRDPILEIVGSGFEEPQILDLGDDEARSVRIKAKNPTVVLLVRGAGIMRIAVPDYQRFASISPPKLTAKVKLEQAVFFGKEDNPLIFDVQHNNRFSDKEYGEAALELSEDILTSTGPHLSPLAARLDANIKDRAGYLGKMMAHLRSIKVDFDRITKWRLLWNAEKMHVAGTLWQKHEEYLHMRPAGAKKTLVAEMVEFIRTEERSNPDPAKGETDDLRHWFIHDIHRMDIFIAWGYEAIKHHSLAKLDAPSIGRFIFEASDLYNSTLRDAFAFRQLHLDLYGLKDEKLDRGVLEGDYSGLPTPWTANKFIANNIKRQVELATAWTQHDADGSAEIEILRARTRETLPELTEVYLSVLQEFARWNIASGDPKLVSDGQKYVDLYNADRHAKTISLADSGSWEAAIKLAESHKSLQALAQVLARELGVLRTSISAPDTLAQIDKIETKIAEKEEKVVQCFETYGESFAFPYYDYILANHGVETLLDYEGDKLFKTMYLRTRPELAKISWINDIVVEKDIGHAADTLFDLSLTREQHVWSKQVELSLAKLALLAESSHPTSKASTPVQEVAFKGSVDDTQLDVIDRELAIIAVQNDFYVTQIRPIIKVALDESAEAGLIREAFPVDVPKKYKVLCQLVDDAMKQLVNGEILDPLTLIDLLTLVKLSRESTNAMADQFFLAIQVASNGLHGEEHTEAERLIWRRCLLREDWATINNTSMQDDAEIDRCLSQTDLFQLYCTLYANQQGSRTKIAHRRLPPSQVVGVYTQTLDRRFTNMDAGYREKLLEAMRWEDGRLCKLMEKFRLEQWTKETQKLAEKAVATEYVVAPTATTGALTRTVTRKLWAKPAEITNGQNSEH
ncbi:Non-repetitive/WGA-negative nucleoporin C-terminal-domain-containing protein [Xylaria sp. CBS 124048]|nr:Non-repetitive/WGA-negative nucleoporin C-terminal-domain-containing protein [Xylaria sp. CBS 124048]